MQKVANPDSELTVSKNGLGSFDHLLIEEPSVELAVFLINKNLVTLSVDRDRAGRIARERGLNLVDDLSATAELNMKRILARAVREAWTEAETTERLSEVVGLTQRQAVSNENHRQGLLREGVPKGIARDASREMAKRQKKQRANVIARTEMQQALNTARREEWKERFGENPSEFARQWVVSKDERLCKICRPLNGTLTPVVTGAYISTIAKKTVDGPPIHPQCRCWERLVRV